MTDGVLLDLDCLNWNECAVIARALDTLTITRSAEGESLLGYCRVRLDPMPAEDE